MCRHNVASFAEDESTLSLGLAGEMVSSLTLGGPSGVTSSVFAVSGSYCTL